MAASRILAWTSSGDRVGSDPAHGPGGVERLVDVHGFLPVVRLDRGGPRPRHVVLGPVTVPLTERRGLARTAARSAVAQGAKTGAWRSPAILRILRVRPATSAAVIELTAGAIAAGGGCVARAADGRVVFVRHALPGERVMAEVTAGDLLLPPGRCCGGPRGVPRPGGAPVSATPVRADAADATGSTSRLPAQRRLKAELVAEQLRRVAGIERGWRSEPLDGAADGLGWRTRVQVRRRPLGEDRAAQAPIPRHRTGRVAARSPPTAVRPGRTWVRRRGRGPTTSRSPPHPTAAEPVVSVETGRGGLAGRPAVDAGLVVDGRTVRRPDRIRVRGARPDGSRSAPVCSGRCTRRRPPCSPSASSMGWPRWPGSGWPTSTPGPGCSPCPWPSRSAPTVGWWPWSEARSSLRRCGPQRRRPSSGGDRAVGRRRRRGRAARRWLRTWSCSTRPARVPASR